MKRIRVNLDKISDFDLQLAKNPRAVAMLEKIIPLSLEKRAQELKALQQQIDKGEADLFAEHVASHLLDHRNAEWIQVLHKNLPEIERELQARRPSQSATSPSAEPAPKTTQQTTQPPQAPRRQPPQQTHSELLDFLATQKPPKPPASSSGRSTTVKEEEKASLFSIKELALGGLLFLILVLSIGFVLFSEERSSDDFRTFRAQEQSDSPEAREARRQEEEIQTEFDAAAQELRFGDFEIGNAQLLQLAERAPQSIHAENAYVLIADTARLRKHDPDLALRTYQTFLEKWPESSKAGLVQLKMGFTYEDLEDFSSAEAAYRLLISKAGKSSRLGQLAHDRLQRLKEQGL